MSQLRLLSHNQWKRDVNTPEWAARGEDCSAAVREAGFARVFAELQPDIIGCQEVSGLMMTEMMLSTKAKGLHYAGLWGYDVPILYKPEKLELLDSAGALYPDELPGREGCFNNEHTKGWTLGVFRTKEDGKVFIFATTHLWYKSDDPNDVEYYQPHSNEARVYQMQLVTEQICAYQKKYACPAILVGDMNAPLGEDVIQYALHNGYAHAKYLATEFSDDTEGYHYCKADGYRPYVPGRFEDAIDHILVRDLADGAVRRFERYTPDYYLPLSDHSPVFVDIVL